MNIYIFELQQLVMYCFSSWLKRIIISTAFNSAQINHHSGFTKRNGSQRNKMFSHCIWQWRIDNIKYIAMWIRQKQNLLNVGKQTCQQLAYESCQQLVVKHNYLNGIQFILNKTSLNLSSSRIAHKIIMCSHTPTWQWCHRQD